MLVHRLYSVELPPRPGLLRKHRHPLSSCSPSLSCFCPGGQWGKLSMAKFWSSPLPALSVVEWHTAPVHNLTKTWHCRYRDAMNPFKSGTEKQLWWEEITGKSGQALRGSISRRPSQDSSVFSLSKTSSPSVPHHAPVTRVQWTTWKLLKASFSFVWQNGYGEQIGL